MMKRKERNAGNVNKVDDGDDGNDDQDSSLLKRHPQAPHHHHHHLHHHHPHVVPCYRRFSFWAFVILVIMVIAFLTTDTLLLQLLKNVPYSTSATTTTTTTTTGSDQDDINNTGSRGTKTTKTKATTTKKTTTKAATTAATAKTAKTTVGQATKGATTTKKTTKATTNPSSTAKTAKTTAATITTTKGATTTKKTTTEKATTSTTKGTTTTTKTRLIEVSSSSSPLTFAIRYRGPQLNHTAKIALADKWGRWNMPEDLKAPRPALPCEEYSHCDVPRAKLPPNAWQADPEFLKHFLTQAQDLVIRAQEAILAEYEQSKFDIPNKTLAQRSKNLQLSFLTLDGKVHPPDPEKEILDNGGWTTSRSFQGLVRRLLHAIMTQDTFTYVLGGNSVAAGHGNQFKQSYAMQFHRVMEPVLGRLGVKLNSHNFGHGALGTTQEAMGMGGLWGKEIDFCMWDSILTEHVSGHYDLFARQALISGNRVPILWNGYVDIMEILHNKADVDIGGWGTGMIGIPVTESEQHAKTLPYAVQFLKCPPDKKSMCEWRRYRGQCWVNRPDVTPLRNQGTLSTSGAAHHPGFRSTQLTGRVLAFTLLTALQEGLKQWKSAQDFALPDSAWHVSGYYQNIRTKLAKLNTTACFQETTLPTPRLCYTPMKAVSEYTPRGNPEQSSIRSIMKDTTYMPPAPDVLFHGPDVTNPALEPPNGGINYFAIVENIDTSASSVVIQSERRLVSVSSTSTSSSLQHPSLLPKKTTLITTETTASDGRRRRLNNVRVTLPVGRGWHPNVKHGDVHCNGTYDSDECGRSPTSTCLMMGHNDGRGGLVFDSFSGWLLLQLKGVKEGLIIIKLETWLHPGDYGGYFGAEVNMMTEGWTSENNGTTPTTTTTKKGRRRRRLLSSSIPSENIQGATITSLDHRRRLKQEPNAGPDLCPEFMFDYALDGKIYTLNRDQFLSKKKFVQRIVETLTLLDDPKFTTTKTTGNEVELGIRMRGCKRINTFKLTHVYWA